MPTTQQREISDANKQAGQAVKDLNRAHQKYADLEEKHSKLRLQRDALAGENKALQREVSNLQKRADELVAQKGDDTHIGRGSYVVVSENDKVVRGRPLPKGSMLGFITVIEGFAPEAVGDALHFGSARLVESEHHELYTQLMAQADSTEKLAEAEVRIRELEATVAELIDEPEPEDDEEAAGGDGGE